MSMCHGAFHVKERLNTCILKTISFLVSELFIQRVVKETKTRVETNTYTSPFLASAGASRARAVSPMTKMAARVMAAARQISVFLSYKNNNDNS